MKKLPKALMCVALAATIQASAPVMASSGATPDAFCGEPTIISRDVVCLDGRSYITVTYSQSCFFDNGTWETRTWTTSSTANGCREGA